MQIVQIVRWLQNWLELDLSLQTSACSHLVCSTAKVACNVGIQPMQSRRPRISPKPSRQLKFVVGLLQLPQRGRKQKAALWANCGAPKVQCTSLTTSCSHSSNNRMEEANCTGSNLHRASWRPVALWKALCLCGVFVTGSRVSSPPTHISHAWLSRLRSLR